jgi:dethiobiotin synthetase
VTPLRGTVIITGTDTGVGKTIVTAAIAAAATAAGLTVAVAKPAQTGVITGDEPDAATVDRLAAPKTVRTFVAYPDPLAPLAAARVAGEAPLPVMEAHLGVRRLGRDHDLVLVEGAGGLLVPLGAGGWTAADMAVALGAPAVVVVRAGLGTLNHTALTLEALDRRRVPAYVVIGSWPNHPELVHRTNLEDLPGRLVGVLPEGVGAMSADDFRKAAPGWLDPALYGTFDAAGFRARS